MVLSLANKPSFLSFPESREKIKFISIFFLSMTLNIICLVDKKNIFLRFCLCIFKSDTVKSDCPVQIFFKKVIKYLKIKYKLLRFTILEALKKKGGKALKMTSQQIIFRAFFRPPTLILKKIP